MICNARFSFIILWAWFASGFASHAHTQLEIAPAPNGAVRISGYTEHPAVLQVSGDLQKWSNLRRYEAGSPVDYLDYRRFPQRVYRLHPVASPLEDLKARPNSVFLANEGFNTIQFSPSGMLGFIVWRDQDLIYRERGLDGTWSEAVVSRSGGVFKPSSGEDFRFQPLATLLFDSSSQPQVLQLSGSGLIHYTRSADGRWTEKSHPISSANSPFTLFAAEIGANNTLHVALASSGGDLVYGSNQRGWWQWSRVATISNPRGFLPQTYAPRFFSMAVDSHNSVHLTFAPEFRLPQYGNGYVRPYSELAYASNRSGPWIVERVAVPSDDSADAGAGASVAIDSNGQPAIACWLNDRVATGSSNESELRYYWKNSLGTWSSTVVARSCDRYAAGDGERGTGFAPYLRFDARGRPHILFSDHASEHFGNSGQNEFCGQIRHAVLNAGHWSFETVYRQSAPLKEQVVYPAFALASDEIAAIGLERRTEFGPDSWPRVVTSTYRFVFLTAPLR